MSDRNDKKLSDFIEQNKEKIYEEARENTYVHATKEQINDAIVKCNERYKVALQWLADN